MRTKGPLTTDKIEKQKHVKSQGSENMEDRLSLNLQKNKDGLLECGGRLQGDYLIYIPDVTTFAKKYVKRVHKATLHRGVGLNMAKVREEYWVPCLSHLVKSLASVMGAKASRLLEWILLAALSTASTLEKKEKPTWCSTHAV